MKWQICSLQQFFDFILSTETEAEDFIVDIVAS